MRMENQRLNGDTLVLERDLSQILSVEVSLEELFAETLKGINYEQMLLLFREGDRIAPRTVVEIGSRAGTSSVILGILAKKHDGTLYCIDPRPHSRWEPNIEKYGLKEHCLMIKLASPWVPWDKIVDMVFVDGNHDFIPCLCDFYYWQRFIRPGGLIAVHDTMIRDGVKRAIVSVIDKFDLELVGSELHGTGIVMFRRN